MHLANEPRLRNRLKVPKGLCRGGVGVPRVGGS